MSKRYKDPAIVAVTGGIGSGQSTVCNYLSNWGCKVINADNKAKEAIHKSRRLQSELKGVFGDDIFNSKKQLDAQKLAERAFKDEFHTQKLNQLVHPRMVEYLVEEMERARFSGRFPVIIIDAALIFEISIERMFDAVVVVTASVAERQRRVRERDQMTRRQFMERVNKQIPLEEKEKWADYVIDNNGTPEELKTNTRTVYEQLMRLQARKEKEMKRVS